MIFPEFFEIETKNNRLYRDIIYVYLTLIMIIFLMHFYVKKIESERNIIAEDDK